MIRVIYISGYGRSGSTLLERLMGDKYDVFQAGELTRIFKDALSGRECECGERILNCRFWNSVLLEVLGNINEATLLEAASITIKNESWLSSYSVNRSKEDYEAYVDLWRNMLQAISSNTGCEVIIDSSKSARYEARRSILISRIPEVNLSILHLARDLRGVLNSARKGTNKSIRDGKPILPRWGMIGTTIAWHMSNLRSIYNAKKMQSKPTYLTYEFMADNIGIVSNLGDKYNLSLITRNRENNGHAVGGNRMRRNRILTIRKDDKWKSELPVQLSILGYSGLILYKYIRGRYE